MKFELNARKEGNGWRRRRGRKWYFSPPLSLYLSLSPSPSIFTVLENCPAINLGKLWGCDGLWHQLTFNRKQFRCWSLEKWYLISLYSLNVKNSGCGFRLEKYRVLILYWASVWEVVKNFDIVRASSVERFRILVFCYKCWMFLGVFLELANDKHLAVVQHRCIQSGHVLCFIEMIFPDWSCFFVIGGTSVLAGDSILRKF